MKKEQKRAPIIKKGTTFGDVAKYSSEDEKMKEIIMKMFQGSSEKEEVTYEEVEEKMKQFWDTPIHSGRSFGLPPMEEEQIKVQLNK